MRLGPEDLLAGPNVLAMLQLGDEAEPFLSWETEFRCSRDGLIDGFAGWFDCLLAHGIRMTNSPLAAKSLDRPQAYLPLEMPLRVSQGEVVRVIKALAEEGRTMLIVTHDMKLAQDVANHVIFLHQGVIEEEGDPGALFGRTRSARLRQFLSATGA